MLRPLPWCVMLNGDQWGKDAPSSDDPCWLLYWELTLILKRNSMLQGKCTWCDHMMLWKLLKRSRVPEGWIFLEAHVIEVAVYWSFSSCLIWSCLAELRMSSWGGEDEDGELSRRWGRGSIMQTMSVWFCFSSWIWIVAQTQCSFWIFYSLVNTKNTFDQITFPSVNVWRRTQSYKIKIETWPDKVSWIAQLV